MNTWVKRGLGFAASMAIAVLFIIVATPTASACCQSSGGVNARVEWPNDSVTQQTANDFLTEGFIGFAYDCSTGERILDGDIYVLQPDGNGNWNGVPFSIDRSTRTDVQASAPCTIGSHVGFTISPQATIAQGYQTWKLVFFGYSSAETVDVVVHIVN